MYGCDGRELFVAEYSGVSRPHCVWHAPLVYLIHCDLIVFCVLALGTASFLQLHHQCLENDYGAYYMVVLVRFVAGVGGRRLSSFPGQ